MVGFSLLAFSFYDLSFFIHLLRRQNNDQKCDILQFGYDKTFGFALHISGALRGRRWDQVSAGWMLGEHERVRGGKVEYIRVNCVPCVSPTAPDTKNESTM